MFKDRLRLWNVKRNLSRTDVAAALQLIRQAERNGRPGNLYIRDEHVDRERIETYLRRAKESMDSILAASDLGDHIPSHVQLRPLDSDITMPFSTPLTQPGPSLKTSNSMYNGSLISTIPSTSRSSTELAESNIATAESSQKHGEANGGENTACGDMTSGSPSADRNQGRIATQLDLDQPEAFLQLGGFTDLAYPTNTVQQFSRHLIDRRELPVALPDLLDLSLRMSASPSPDEPSSGCSTISSGLDESSLCHRRNALEEAAGMDHYERHQAKDESREELRFETAGFQIEPRNYTANFLAFSITGCLRLNEGMDDAAESAMRVATMIFAEMIAIRHESCLTSLSLLTALLDAHGKREVTTCLLDKFKAAALSMKDLPEKDSVVLTIRFMSDIMSGIKIESLSSPEDLKKVFNDFERYWGPGSPSTLVCLCHLGWRLAGEKDAERLTEGWDVLSRARSTAEQILDPCDPQTIMSLTMLARVLHNLNRHPEALEVMRTAMDRIIIRFPDYHPYRLSGLRRFSLIMQELGPYDAEPILREVAAKRLRVLGPDSHLTQASMKELKELLIEKGRTDEAENAWRDTTEVASRLFRGVSIACSF